MQQKCSLYGENTAEEEEEEGLLVKGLRIIKSFHSMEYNDNNDYDKA
jgi:hypothetical protein